jgi:hypothetical protein
MSFFFVQNKWSMVSRSMLDGDDQCWMVVNDAGDGDGG